MREFENCFKIKISEKYYDQIQIENKFEKKVTPVAQPVRNLGSFFSTLFVFDSAYILFIKVIKKIF